MKINKKLNLVFPVIDDDENTSYIYHIPISLEVYEDNCFILAKLFSELVDNEIMATTGPSVSYSLLKNIAKEHGGIDRLENGLIKEIVRLSHYVYKDKNGAYENTQLSIAMQRGVIDEDSYREAISNIIFFTLALYVLNRSKRKFGKEIVLTLMNAQTTSLQCTAFMNTLTTFKPEDVT